jgi:hypothetical protein
MYSMTLPAATAAAPTEIMPIANPCSMLAL